MVEKKVIAIIKNSVHECSRTALSSRGHHLPVSLMSHYAANRGRVDEGVTLVKVSRKALLYKRVSYWLTRDNLNLVR